MVLGGFPQCHDMGQKGGVRQIVRMERAQWRAKSSGGEVSEVKLIAVREFSSIFEMTLRRTFEIRTSANEADL